MSDQDDDRDDAMEDVMDGTETSMHPDEARMLRLAIDEVRGEPVPELDWDRMERELLAAIDEDPPTPLRVEEEERRGTPYLWAVVAAAAAAMLFASWLWQQGPTSQATATAPTPAPVAEGEVEAPLKGTRAVDVRALAPASVVEAGKQTVTFTLAGVVTWKLSPGGRAVVDTVSVPHEIRLERGRIDAEVNPDRPGQPLEAFAIVADETRVAVRGTVFSVERSADGVTVAVSRGKVAVGNRSRKGPVEVLVSPAEQTFDLRGQPLAKSDEADATKPDSEPTAPAPTVALADDGDDDGANEGANVGPEPAPETKTEPGDADEPAVTRMSVGQAQSSMLSCLDAAVHGRPDGSVTIASTVTVVLGPQGRVDAVRFSPPLEPSLQSQCSSALFGQHLEGEGTATFSIQLTK